MSISPWSSVKISCKTSLHMNQMFSVNEFVSAEEAGDNDLYGEFTGESETELSGESVN